MLNLEEGEINELFLRKKTNGFNKLLFIFSIRFFEMDDMTGKKGENIRQAVPFVRQITQDGKPKLEVYRPTTNPIYYYSQVSFHNTLLPKNVNYVLMPLNILHIF